MCVENKICGLGLSANLAENIFRCAYYLVDTLDLRAETNVIWVVMERIHCCPILFCLLISNTVGVLSAVIEILHSDRLAERRTGMVKLTGAL
jgi:hypothetical protein